MFGWAGGVVCLDGRVVWSGCGVVGIGCGMFGWAGGVVCMWCGGGMV